MRASAKRLRIADFRSDTLTWPTAEMLSSIRLLNCSTGDDVYGEDKDTKNLESTVAQLAGKEAGLFCVSGTMSNQLALRTRLKPLESVLLDRQSHIFNYENHGIAFYSQAGCIPVSAASGGKHITLDDIRRHAIVDEDIHWTRTSVICLENTLNGSIYPHESLINVYKYAKSNGIWLHLDGARLWHAAVSTGISLNDWCKHTDSVSLCLSKGIGAPIGSVLCGPSEFIEKARHFRKLFGGGWRQSGVLAAMAHEALEKTYIRNNGAELKRVHEMTQFVACELDRMPKLTVLRNPGVETNMIFVNVAQLLPKGDDLSGAVMKASDGKVRIASASSGYGSQTNETDNSVVRLVFHYQHSIKDCQFLIEAFKQL